MVGIVCRRSYCNYMDFLTATATLALINLDRAIGLRAPLEYSPFLSTVAHERCVQMKEFSHDGWKEIVAKRSRDRGGVIIGENLAIGFADPKTLVYAWQNSQLHRANNMSGYYRYFGMATCNNETVRKSVVKKQGVYVYGATTVAVYADFVLGEYVPTTTYKKK